MIEYQQISSLSTQYDYNQNMNKTNSEDEKEKKQIPEWLKCTSKKFKNLVECYLCKVDDCQILFNTQEELNEHNESHLNLYKCNYPQCEKSFMKIINLRKHKKMHYKNIRKYNCPFEGCGKSFTASYSLTLHYRIHSGITRHECEICGKKFFDRANYQYHLQNMHTLIRKKKIICQHKNCGHKSKSIKQLIMHHDKLEEVCIKEKMYLLKLIMFYQNASIHLLNNKIINNEKLKDLGQQFGVDEEIKNIWRKNINNCELDEELKKELNFIEIQSNNLMNKSLDKSRYQGIIDYK